VYHPGKNVWCWKRLYHLALTDGVVEFKKGKGDKSFISVNAVAATA